MTQGSYRALINYLLIFVLAVFTVACSSGGDEDGGTGAVSSSTELDADPGPVVLAYVGVTATLDGSNSSGPGGSLTFAWSFTHKPDGSNAELTGSTTARPSFTPDVEGTYMVQMVVTTGGVASRRIVASVEAIPNGTTLDNSSSLFRHAENSKKNSHCVECHNEVTLFGTGAGRKPLGGKPSTHIATSNTCQACHSVRLRVTAFDITPFVDHQDVYGNCKQCHNGILAIGQSDRHIVTTAECDECHNTTSFLELELDGSFDHTDITRGCDGCHNGIVAIGKDAKVDGHLTTDADCYLCHTTDNFIPATGVDHSVFDFSVTSCVSCHDGAGPGESSVGKSLNHPVTSDDCQSCHNTRTFDIGGNFNHDVIDDEVGGCVICHDGNHVAAGALGITDTAIHANKVTIDGLDCGTCHNTRTFVGATVDHSIVVGACAQSGCHDGVLNPDGTEPLAPGMPSIGHINTTQDCGDCHTPGNFATGSFDHVAAGIVDNCNSCHNDDITAGTPVDHIPVSTGLDCSVCHLIKFDDFTGAVFDHASTDTTDCRSCHNGSITTGLPRRGHVPIPDTVNCSACHNSTTIFTSTTIAPISFDHQGNIGGCIDCHNGRFSFVDTDDSTNTLRLLEKSSDHIPAQNDCSICHSTTSFAPATLFVSTVHPGLANGSGGCEGCHNGQFTNLSGTLVGKANNHLPTNQDCDSCHSIDAFSPHAFAHVGITGNCVSCHDGNYVGTVTVRGMSLVQSAGGQHPDTTTDCGACHTTASIAPLGVSFLNYFVDHSNLVNNCTNGGCHAEDLTYANSNAHGPTNGNDCELCHVAGSTFVPAIFDHSNLGRNPQCNTCHDGLSATGKNNGHISTIQNGQEQDCDVCHNTTAFAGARFNHQGITGDCATCHNGTTAIGKANRHVPTNDDCSVCHKTTGFIPATFDHVGITDNCESCHDGIFATGKDAKTNPAHVTTSQDCGVCHNTTGFIPAGFDHTGITNNCTRAGCHGDGATAMPDPPAHAPTNEDCSLCHSTSGFAGANWTHVRADTENQCKTCHSPGNGATPQPANGQNGHFDTTEQCDVCHVTTGWSNTRNYVHSNRNRTYPGDHRAGKTTCKDCHRTNREDAITYPNDPQYAPDCAGCHAGDFRREGDHIGGNNGTVSQNRDCGDSGCHRVSSNGF